MQAPSVEQRFERYRQAGDVHALAAASDRTAPDLLGLAAHLSSDPGAAEDALQARSSPRSRRRSASTATACWRRG